MFTLGMFWQSKKVLRGFGLAVINGRKIQILPYFYMPVFGISFKKRRARNGEKRTNIEAN